MAGHSKWANIKHRKERQDAKKGKIFTKWIRELTVAARQGGGDPGSNPRLRLALDKALGANMSRDIIDRAVARGAGAADTDDMVLNGTELGGGSIRIHRKEMQQSVFRLLGIDEAEQEEKFGFLLDALIQVNRVIVNVHREQARSYI